MADKVYKPQEIDDSPLPGQVVPAGFSVASPGTKESSEPSSIKENRLPSPRIALELLSSSLNTKSKKILAEFEFTESGALQIGKYQNGVSGDLKISPNGIVARNDAGITTFAIDGTTGNAVFKGEVQAGSLISGKVIVGDNRVIIDGGNSRILVYDDDGIPRILIGYQEAGF